MQSNAASFKYSMFKFIDFQMKKAATLLNARMILVIKFNIILRRIQMKK